MNIEEQRAWLKSLKQGDKVCKKVWSWWNKNRCYYDMLTIKKVTPKGNIRLSNDVLIKIDTVYNTDLEPITEKYYLLNSEIKKKDKLKKITESLDVYELPMEKVNRLLEILNEEESC